MADDRGCAWIQRGFEEFSNGCCDNGGDNLYVNAAGIIERIHRLDVNGDGHVDLVFPNSHGYIERGPTWIYTQSQGAGADWPRRQLENDSGWMSRAVDVDGDGYLDLIVVNGENGVISELDSYVYWGGAQGLTGARTELPTAGAYDVAAVDLRGCGRLDLIFPSAWVDHHNPGQRRLIQIYEQVEGRRFAEVSERYGLEGIAALGVACEDLNGDGRPELVVANYREEFEYDTDSFVYWGTEDGFDASNPLRLPSHFALQVVLGDLDGDGFKEIIFSGGNRIYIYWNRGGHFRAEDVEVVETEGNSTMFAQGAVRTAVADVDGDGRNELLVAALEGIEIRAGDELHRVRQLLPLKYSGWVEAVDLDGDGRLDLVVSRYQDGSNYETNSALIWNGPQGLGAGPITWLPSGGAVGATAADLDGDGRPEIIFNNTMGGPSQINPDFPLYVYLGNADNAYDSARRLELPSGGVDGYSRERLEFHPTDASSIMITVADLNKNGYLDLLVPAYSTRFTRELPAYIFWGNERGFDFDEPQAIPCDSSCAFLAVDISGNGYLDLLTVCHRNDLGHQVDSLLFWNGPAGLCFDQVERLPGMGPHLSSPRDFGNAYTRAPVEYYTSPVCDTKGRRPLRLNWKAEVPVKTRLKFQLRWAGNEADLDSAPWTGPRGEGSFYEEPDAQIRGVRGAPRYLQYRAALVSLNGCLSPRLKEVRVDFENQEEHKA